MTRKYFLNALGLEGLNKMLDGFEDRTAEAVCTFAFCQGPGAKPILFQGRTKARIIRQCILNSNLTVFIQGTIVRPRGPVNFGTLISNFCLPSRVVIYDV